MVQGTPGADAGPHLGPEGLTLGHVRDLADGYLDQLIEVDPNLATVLGVRGHDDRLTDYSPDGE